MLHLELRVPSDLTEEVVDLLAGDRTVTNLAVLPHGFREPAGCRVSADVARENASAVIGALKQLGIDERGSIALWGVDTMLSRDADRAERAAPGAPDDGVVWESVEQRLREDSRWTWSFAAFMALAALIAGAGRVLDQPILIVGAMVVGPEFSPIAAFCFGLTRGRPRMLRDSSVALVGGFALALAVAAAFWATAYALGVFSAEQAASGRLTDFIVSPDGWSFLVACLAGVAGTLSLTTNKSGPLVGVFISVTTIPAVGTAGVCLACGLWSEAGQSAVQLGLNVLGLLLSGTLTLLVLRLVWAKVGIPAMSRDTMLALAGRRRPSR